MNGNCQSCNYNSICAYPYKPCDCRDYLKFKLHSNAVECDVCDSNGFNPYPIRCRSCNGTGWKLKDEANQ
jgi:primosomal protein N'